jgi:hypothetical protein
MKKEVKTLYKDLRKLRENTTDAAAKTAAAELVSAKRAEYKAARKNKSTPSV